MCLCILSKLRASGIKSRAFILEQFESQQSFFKTLKKYNLQTDAYVHLVVICGVIKAHKPARMISYNLLHNK